MNKFVIPVIFSIVALCSCSSSNTKQSRTTVSDQSETTDSNTNNLTPTRSSADNSSPVVNSNNNSLDSGGSTIKNDSSDSSNQGFSINR